VRSHLRCLENSSRASGHSECMGRAASRRRGPEVGLEEMWCYEVLPALQSPRSRFLDN